MSSATEVIARPARAAVDLGLVYAVVSAAAFGSSGPFAKALIATGWNPATIVLARIGIAGLVLLGPALYAVRGRWAPLRSEIPMIAAFGALAVAGAQLGYFNAVQRMPIGVALLLEYLGVVLVVLWVWLRSGRRPGATSAAGMGLALAGLVLVLDVVGGLDIDLVGAGWGLFAATGLATYFVITAGSAGRIPPVTLASFGMLTGSVVLLVLSLTGVLPLAAATGDVLIREAQLPWWLAVAELSLVAAAAAYLLGTIGSRRLGSTVASFVGLTEVLFAVVLAWLLLGEVPGPAQLVGGLLILGGVVAVRLGAARTPAS